MNNTFDIKRFWRYLRYDLVSAIQDSGTLLVSLAAMPAWFFLIQQLFSLVFGHEFRPINTPSLIFAYLVSLTMIVIFFPVQHYGKLTDKKAGSDWILLPASRFEKFLSMLVVCCVAAPIAWFAMITACDGLLYLVFGTYNTFAMPEIFHSINGMIAHVHTDNVQFAMNGPVSVYLSWCQNILAFGLGAIFFRKNKIVYTFLALMAIGIVCTVTSAGIIGADSPLYKPEAIDEDNLMRLLNFGIYAIWVVVFVLLDLGLYFRIKTIKH